MPRTMEGQVRAPGRTIRPTVQAFPTAIREPHRSTTGRVPPKRRKLVIITEGAHRQTKETSTAAIRAAAAPSKEQTPGVRQSSLAIADSQAAQHQAAAAGLAAAALVEAGPVVAAAGLAAAAVAAAGPAVAAVVLAAADAGSYDTERDP